jgi:hypothetical protein
LFDILDLSGRKSNAIAESDETQRKITIRRILFNDVSRSLSHIYEWAANKIVPYLDIQPMSWRGFFGETATYGAIPLRYCRF